MQPFTPRALSVGVFGPPQSNGRCIPLRSCRCFSRLAGASGGAAGALGPGVGFLLAAVLLLLWENLSNDLFDADTGIDATAKPHSVVALLGRRRPVRRLSSLVLLAGLLLMLLMALQSSVSVLALVLVSCGIGYLYQGPPFRLGYLGLGEPLCWLAFGPFATAAALMVVAPASDATASAAVPWDVALLLGSGPALATSLVLFCSHFHQVKEDAATASSPLWCAWAPHGRRLWCPGLLLEPWLWSGLPCFMAIGLRPRCSEAWVCPRRQR